MASQYFTQNDTRYLAQSSSQTSSHSTQADKQNVAQSSSQYVDQSAQEECIVEEREDANNTTESKDAVVIVAAIDFGTTFSGYAFSFANKPQNIYMNKNWGESMGFTSYKTPTSVLIGPDGKCTAFGYEAEQMYTEILGDEELADKYQLYRHFKMMLYKNGHINRDSKIRSESGHEHTAMDIFVMALQSLKDHLLGVVKKHADFHPDDPIKWVLTVPAIWREEAKQFMREAAFKAGLIKQQNSRMLVIALEPEAASLYCRGLDIDHFVGAEGEITNVSFEPGSQYMVIDAGGGTVDITVHEVLKDNQVKEIHAANGGAWGGTNVDQQFINLMQRLLGEKMISTFRAESPQQWLAFMTNFEKVKKSVKEDGSGKLAVPLPWTMAQKHLELMGTNIDVVLSETQEPGVAFVNGSLVLTDQAILNLFEPTIQQIVQHIETLLMLPENSRCQYFLIVGGFAECALLQRAIKDSFGARAAILIPEEAQMSVIKGAVLFGHQPEVIKSRIAKKTYGRQSSRKFKEGIHDESKMKLSDGIPYCGQIFSPFVQMGEEVDTGKTEEYTCYPISKSQTRVTFRIFTVGKTVQKKDLVYTDEEGMELMGTFSVNMPDKTGGKSRPVKLHVEYGGTEIFLHATDVTSGSQANTEIDFLTH